MTGPQADVFLTQENVQENFNFPASFASVAG